MNELYHVHETWRDDRVVLAANSHVMVVVKVSIKQVMQPFAVNVLLPQMPEY